MITKERAENVKNRAENKVENKKDIERAWDILIKKLSFCPKSV